MAPSRKEIDEDMVTAYRLQYMNWAKIISALKVSRSTLDRWRKATNYVDPLGEINDDELDQIVAENTAPRRGNVIMQAILRSASYNVTRKRLRASMARVDPEGIEQRKTKPIKRREYVVAGPHYVWHMDGHHKLVKFGFVTHGCIDGYSRAVLYLHCSTNNKASTVLRLFKDAVQSYVMPMQVRGDRGGENVLVADFIIAARGTNRNSYIAGCSKHNTRIERLWRDIYKDVIEFYHTLFKDLVKDGLDIESSLHIFVLHHMFLHRINQDLHSTMHSWNNHSMRTENQATPNQLLLHFHKYPPAPPQHGEYEDSDDEDAEGVPVGRFEVPMTNEQCTQFKNECPPLTRQDAPNTLCDKYMHALDCAYRIVNGD